MKKLMVVQTAWLTDTNTLNLLLGFDPTHPLITLQTHILAEMHSNPDCAS